MNGPFTFLGFRARSPVMVFLNYLFLGMVLSMAGACWASPVRGQDLFRPGPRSIEPGAKGTVVVFMSTQCPCSKSHEDILKTLGAEFRDFSFVAIHSNQNESVEKARSYFGQLRLPFPVLRDENFALANEFQAHRTPYAIVVAPDGRVVYRGGVTNSLDGPRADTNYLREALVEVRGGRPVRVAQTRTLGCAITR